MNGKPSCTKPRQSLPHRPDPQHKATRDIENNSTPYHTQPTNQRKNEKGANFTFRSPNIRVVTNQFKQASVNVAFRGTNTLARLVKTTNTTTTPPYKKHYNPTREQTPTRHHTTNTTTTPPHNKH